MNQKLPPNHIPEFRDVPSAQSLMEKIPYFLYSVTARFLTSTEGMEYPDSSAVLGVKLALLEAGFLDDDYTIERLKGEEAIATKEPHWATVRVVAKVAAPDPVKACWRVERALEEVADPAALRCGLTENGQVEPLQEYAVTGAVDVFIWERDEASAARHARQMFRMCDPHGAGSYRFGKMTAEAVPPDPPEGEGLDSAA